MVDELRKVLPGDPMSAQQSNTWINNMNQFGGMTVSPPMSISWNASGPHITMSSFGGSLQTVLIRHYGGVVGDSDTDCSLAYWVEDLEDSSFIKSDVTPQVPRYPKTQYVCPGSDYYGSPATRYGLWDTTADVLLVAYGEIPFASDCPT